MTTQTQIYKGKFGAEKPTESQVAVLRKMNVREDVIQRLTRQEAYELIRAIMVRYYNDRFEKHHRPSLEIHVRW